MAMIKLTPALAGSTAVPRRRRHGTGRRNPRLAAIGSCGPREYLLTKRKTTVGSASNNDLVVLGGRVSRCHALIKRRLGSYRVIDLESTNGTFINGRRVHRAPIARGDELRFGAVRFAFLGPPGTRELKRRVSLATRLGLLLVIFAAGFALTQHFINRVLSDKLLRTERTESENEAALSRRVATAEAEATKDSALAKQPDWLWRINYYRRMAHLPAVTEDPSLSDGDFKHSRYLVKRMIRTGAASVGAEAHSEDPSDPWYTPEGLRAAQSSDVQQAGEFSGVDGVDAWINIPLHRLSILNPYLLSVGYGYYCESRNCAAALGSKPSFPRTGAGPSPVEFPPDGTSVPIGAFSGLEWPEPLTSCPGYNAPAGYPITLQFDGRLVPQLSAYSVSRDGKPIEVCGFDSSNYTNPDTSTQAWARNVLRGFGAVVLITREPLAHQATYQVSVTASGQTYAWNFAVK